MRIHVSLLTRRGMLAVALVSVGVWLSLTVLGAVERWRGFGAGLAAGAGWTLLAVGLALFVVVNRVVRCPEEQCSFCGVARPQARILVSAEAVSTCDACAPLSLGVVAEDFAQNKPSGTWELVVLDGLPRRCPVAISGPLLAVFLDGPHELATIRAAAKSAERLEHHDCVVRLLGRVPDEEKREEEWLSLGLAHGELGHFDEAMKALAEGTKVGGDASRAWLLNGRAWFGPRRNPDATKEELTSWLQDVEEAQQLASETRPGGWQALMQACHETEAALRLRLGETRRALEALTKADALGPAEGRRLLLRARVLDAGEPPLGRQDAARAVALLHPDSREADEARALLAKLGGQEAS